MTQGDRERWDGRYLGRGDDRVGLPAVFAPYTDVFPCRGYALELACGQGGSAVALARRGLDVVGVDVSFVAIDQARKLAHRLEIGDRCRFEQHDLDDGLPPGPAVDLILCNKFRDRRLDRQIMERLAPAGLLALSVCSEVGAQPGPFRAAPGELTTAFADLELIASGEGDGQAWLVARAGG